MDIFSKLNWVDLLVVIIVLRSSYVAFHDGLSHEIFPLAAAICTVVLSLYYYKSLALSLHNAIGALPVEAAEFVIFTSLALGIGFILRLFRLLLDKIIRVAWHPAIERFGGLLAGMARGAVTASLILIIMVLMPLSYFSYSIKDKSFLGMHFLSIGPVIYEKFTGLDIATSLLFVDTPDTKAAADKPK